MTRQTLLASSARAGGVSAKTTAIDAGRPIVFITGHRDVPMSVQAMEAGAIESLMKPLRDQDLLDAVKSRLARDRARRAQEETLGAPGARFELLTPQERAILL